MRISSTRHRIICFLILLAVAYFIAIIASSTAHASPWRRGYASWHPYGGKGYVCASRGVPRGTWYQAKYKGKIIEVLVVDASGKPMKKMNRHIDFNRAAFVALYGSTKRGVGPVKWRVIRLGHGASTGKAW